jgi:GT2 family glycosyltransferase
VNSTLDVALMVLNWNGADLLRRHLPAVVAASRSSSLRTAVHVIDNGSTDESSEVVAGFPDVELIGLPDNRKLLAYNDAARKLDCQAILLLNNDLSPPPDAVDLLWDAMHADSSIFAVGGLVLDVAEDRVESGPTAARWERQWVLEPDALAGAAEPIDVTYVSGGAGLFRREMFVRLGGFWEALPALYWEDVDLGLRAWLHGWRSVFHPGVTFQHESGSTVKRSISPRRVEFGGYRNRRLIHLAVLLDGRDLRDFLRGEARRSLRKPYYWPAALSLAPRLPAALRQRRRLRRACGPVSVAELQRRWDG